MIAGGQSTVGRKVGDPLKIEPVTSERPIRYQVGYTSVKLRRKVWAGDTVWKLTMYRLYAFWVSNLILRYKANDIFYTYFPNFKMLKFFFSQSNGDY